MPELGSVAEKVRSKNAGPFWLTIDVFCGDEKTYERVRTGLESGRVAELFGIPSQVLKRFDLPQLHVVKFSCPRPSIQGSVEDRDMHGAAAAALLAEIEIA